MVIQFMESEQKSPLLSKEQKLNLIKNRNHGRNKCKQWRWKAKE